MHPVSGCNPELPKLLRAPKTPKLRSFNLFREVLGLWVLSFDGHGPGSGLRPPERLALQLSNKWVHRSNDLIFPLARRTCRTMGRHLRNHVISLSMRPGSEPPLLVPRTMPVAGPSSPRLPGWRSSRAVRSIRSSMLGIAPR